MTGYSLRWDDLVPDVRNEERNLMEWSREEGYRALFLSEKESTKMRSRTRKQRVEEKTSLRYGDED